MGSPAIPGRVSTEAIASGKQKMLNALLGLGLFILAGLILKTINPDVFPVTRG